MRDQYLSVLDYGGLYTLMFTPAEDVLNRDLVRPRRPLVDHLRELGIRLKDIHCRF